VSVSECVCACVCGGGLGVCVCVCVCNFFVCVQDFDLDGNGTVDLEEFKHMVKVLFFYFLQDLAMSN